MLYLGQKVKDAITGEGPYILIDDTVDKFGRVRAYRGKVGRDSEGHLGQLIIRVWPQTLVEYEVRVRNNRAPLFSVASGVLAIVAALSWVVAGMV